MLSEHFSVEEFQSSSTAQSLAIVNIMPEHLFAAASALCRQVLEPIRAEFGVPLVLHSGYRSRALNRAIGSKDTSQHRRGEAADFTMPEGPDNATLVRWIASSGLPFDQLILEASPISKPRSGWVHVSHAFTRSQRAEVLTMVLGSHGASYRTGINA